MSKNKKEKNPGIAALLSFFVPGAGQIYNEQIWQGILWFIAYCISLVLCILVIGFIFAPLVWIIGILDAYKEAKKTQV